MLLEALPLVPQEQRLHEPPEVSLREQPGALPEEELLRGQRGALPEEEQLHEQPEEFPCEMPVGWSFPA